MLTRLLNALDGEVVDHDADVAVRAGKHEWRLVRRAQARVDPRDEALRGGFLVACRPVDLTGKEEALWDGR